MTSTADKAWAATLHDLFHRGEDASPRGRRTKEILCRQSQWPMASPVVRNPARKLGYRFMAGEAAWIAGGDNRVETIAPYSKTIRDFSDDGHTFAGAYGPKFVDQVGYVARCLREDKDTRQAVMTIWRERPGPSADIPCTVALQWFMRGGELHCSATMRSSDAWLGVPYDVVNFSVLSAYVAILTGYLRLGTLFLTCGSQHLYESNWEDAHRALSRDVVAVPPVAPADLAPFAKPSDLIAHLWALAHREKTTGWMAEIVS
jgi:thymidylate synthase